MALPEVPLKKELYSSRQESSLQKQLSSLPSLFEKIITSLATKEESEKRQKTKSLQATENQYNKINDINVSLKTLTEKQEVTTKLLKNIFDALKNKSEQGKNGNQKSPLEALSGFGGDMLKKLLIGGALGAVGASLFSGFFSDKDDKNESETGSEIKKDEDRTQTINIANQPVSREAPLTKEQITAIETSTRMGNSYPAWVMEKYNSEKSQQNPAPATPVAPGPVAGENELNTTAQQYQASVEERAQVEKEKAALIEKYGAPDTKRTVSPQRGSGVYFSPYDVAAYSNPEVQSQHLELIQRRSESADKQGKSVRDATRIVGRTNSFVDGPDEDVAVTPEMIQALTTRYGYTSEELQKYGGGPTSTNYTKVNGISYSSSIRNLFDEELKKELTNRAAAAKPPVSERRGSEQRDAELTNPATPAPATPVATPVAPGPVAVSERRGSEQRDAELTNTATPAPATPVATPVAPAPVARENELNTTAQQYQASVEERAQIAKERAALKEKYGAPDKKESTSWGEQFSYSDPEVQRKHLELNRRRSQSDAEQKKSLRDATNIVVGPDSFVDGQDENEAVTPEMIQALTTRYGYTSEELQKYGGGPNQKNYIEVNGIRYSINIRDLFDKELKKDLEQRAAAKQFTKPPVSERRGSEQRDAELTNPATPVASPAPATPVAPAPVAVSERRGSEQQDSINDLEKLLANPATPAPAAATPVPQPASPAPAPATVAPAPVAATPVPQPASPAPAAVATPVATAPVAGEKELNTTAQQYQASVEEIAQIENEITALKEKYGAPDKKESTSWGEQLPGSYSNPEVQSQHLKLKQQTLKAKSQQKESLRDATKIVVGTNSFVPGQDEDVDATPEMIQALTTRYGYTSEELQRYGGGPTQKNYIEVDRIRYNPKSIRKLFDEELKKDLTNRAATPVTSTSKQAEPDKIGAGAVLRERFDSISGSRSPPGERRSSLSDGSYQVASASPTTMTDATFVPELPKEDLTSSGSNRPSFMNTITSVQQTSSSSPSGASTPSGPDGTQTEETKSLDNKPENVKISSTANVDKVDKDLLGSFYAAAKEYGKPVTINSAFRDDAKQAELWVRANVFREPGIFMPAKPDKDTTINYKGQTFNVPGGRARSSHGGSSSTANAIDISRVDADTMDSMGLFAKYGLNRPFPNDPVHIQKKGGGSSAPTMEAATPQEVQATKVQSDGQTTATGPAGESDAEGGVATPIQGAQSTASGGGSGGGGATMSPSTPSSGSAALTASVGNEVAKRSSAESAQPPSPETPSAPNSGTGDTNYGSSTSDPGNVEPADAATRYRELFGLMAA